MDLSTILESIDWGFALGSFVCIFVNMLQLPFKKWPMIHLSFVIWPLILSIVAMAILIVIKVTTGWSP